MLLFSYLKTAHQLKNHSNAQLRRIREIKIGSFTHDPIFRVNDLMRALNNILQDTSMDSMIAVQMFINLFHIRNPEASRLRSP
jgi:hypothetical protein